MVKLRNAPKRSLYLSEPLSLLLIFVSALVCFYLMELPSHNPLRIPLHIQLVNLVCFVLLILFWTALTGSSTGGIVITAVLSLTIGYLNYAVIVFRDKPIFPWDLYSLNTALTVTKNYLWPSPLLIWFILLLIIILLLVTLLFKMRFSTRLSRLIILLLSPILLFCYTLLFRSPVFTQTLAFNETLFNQKYMYEQNGFMPSFLINLRYARIEQPPEYSLEKVEEIATMIESDLLPQDPPAGGKYPHIIVIMNESFADLSVVSPFTTNKEVMPFLNSLSDNTVKGNLAVSIVGGNTATSEFEFLSGDSMYFLPPGSVAYQQFIRGHFPALPTTLKASGYHTVAVHPFGAKGWNRQKIYEYFDFAQTMFIEDFHNPEYVRQYISDRAIYRQLISSFSQNDREQPLFYFIVTIQNHGGYSQTAQHLPIDIEITGGSESIFDTNHYLSLLHESDQAFKELLQYFSQIDDNTIILFFGDHQPHDYALSGLIAENGFNYSDEEMTAARKTVPFWIWANYPIEAKSDMSLSVNYLASLLLDTAGVPQSPYNYFLTELRDAIPVITDSFDPDSAVSGSIGTQERALLEQYGILQYNHLGDEGNRNEWLFEPILP